uniref:NADP-dependent oxidoreductase domain-containing protein n=1 Tax=Aplanochytrium stocchinoi TaxID=215587 RepID=A0A6S8D0N7_9STRA
MEALVDNGLAREIGVSNFPVALLHELLSDCRIPPAVNQVELHPYLQQEKLLRYCNKRGIHVQAYSPLGTTGYKEKHEPNVLADPILNDIATVSFKRLQKVPLKTYCLCSIYTISRVCVKRVNMLLIYSNI